LGRSATAKKKYIYVYIYIHIYCFSLYVPGNYVPIIRRKYRTHATPGIYHSIKMTFRYAERNEFRPAYQTAICTYRVTNGRYRISTVFSPDIFSWWWKHSCPKHVEKSNKHVNKICAPSWFYLQDYTRMDGQQNIKFSLWVWFMLRKNPTVAHQ
jgi:hypothetical protein